MSLAIYGHFFSSYTQKVLMALYENGTPFEFRALGQDTPGHVGEWLKRWPLRKFPVLVDGDRTVVETSIIIEYLQLAHPGPVRLIPADPMAALDVRFLDRFFDLHVMNMMQLAVDGALTGDPTKRKDGHDAAIEKLERAYAWLENELAGRTRRRCSMPTGCIGFPNPIRPCAPTERACSQDRPSPAASRRHGRSAPSSRWAPRTGISKTAKIPRGARDDTGFIAPPLVIPSVARDLS
jgi:glutathione S-transferase